MPAYQITTAGRDYPVTADDLARADVHQTAPGRFHFIRDDHNYDVEVLNVDLMAKTVRLRVNGREHELRLRDEVDQLVQQLGFATAAATVTKDVHAPMPGLVLDVLVEAGQSVEAGTPLLILEAMKMENVLKADTEGEVTAVAVAKGEAVEKRQLLIEIA